MFHILGFLFIIVIAVIIIGLALVGSVLRAVFGLGKRSPSSGSDRNGPNNNSGSRRYYHQTGKLVFGAEDDKRGYQRYAPQALHPKTVVVKGILADECAGLMKDFFAAKRR
jgi:hypothetical protein